jgi:hypothetical protein
MPVPLRVIRDRVRAWIKDVDSRHPVVGTPALDMAIADVYLVLGGMMPAPLSYTASAFTISAGAETFTLPTTATTGWTGGSGRAEYGGEVRIQLVTSGRFLERRTREEIDAWRNGQPSASPVLGEPSQFALWVESDQDVQGIVYPGAQSAQTCNLFRSMSYDDLRDYVGSGSDDLDDVSVQFSRLGSVALGMMAAAIVIRGMVDEDLKRCRLNPRLADSLEKMARDSLYSDLANRADIEGAGRIMRWVS